MTKEQTEITLKPVIIGLGWFAGCSSDERKKRMDRYLTGEYGLCGCGKPVTHITPDKSIGACNQHARCPTKESREQKVTEIKEGPDLDRVIAEEIGLISVHCVVGSDIEFWFCSLYGKDSVPRTFRPSTDLNDAFYAAKLSCLFDVVQNGPEVHLAKTIDGQWEILTGAVGWQSATVCGEMGYLARESTPELAICAAILKLALR